MGESVTHPGWEFRIAGHFRVDGTTVVYEYDFGDGWEHELVFEGKAVRYPQCVEGARACPPEDYGGPPGFEEFLEAIADPEHPEHEDTLKWAGGCYNPERFDSGLVRFDDPKKRWCEAFGGN